MADPSGVDRQFVMLRTALRGKILECLEKTLMPGQWSNWLPELAERLEEILYGKFPNRNGYYSMMLAPIEPQMQYAIRALSAQNQQNQQNSQMAREAASSSPQLGTRTMMLSVSSLHPSARRTIMLMSVTELNGRD